MTLNTPVQLAGQASGYGLWPRDEDVMVVNRSAPSGDTNPTSETILKGEVCGFCLLTNARITADGLTIQGPPGSPGSLLASVTHKWSGASATELQVGLWCVALEDIGPAMIGKVRVRGRVSANVWHSANTAITPGMKLVTNIGKSGYLDALGVPVTATNARRILGVTLDNMGGTTSTGGAMTILFDGLNGFGGING